ncbi:glycoside hydrolase family 172 protein [Ulvibacterium sp.]|uniref:glycoside hydrolase family 172 protein n=1 Tax=Ulvibacterium sp. TaxID=2665914 RepID=UPI0026108392|nr:glycoside hydrolase family 172 protein [Ulvibacterium sp.]
MRITLTVLTFSVLTLFIGCQQPKTETKETGFSQSDIEKVYKAAPEGVHTRWVSSENRKGEKGRGGMTNKGAKGDAFSMIGPGDTLVIFDQKGPGIITKIWAANSFGWNQENRRKVSINMYWDNAAKPAVSVPFTDFFGIGLGLMRPFENTFFSMPEGRSFNCSVPMPFRTAGKVEIVNESDDFLMFYYKINMVTLQKLDDDTLYFHAYWNRDMATTKGVDYAILPKVNGRGRYLGTNIGVIGNESYKGTWFGEGEVKIYLDGDEKFPTLVGTGTEDYIGTGWGQGEFDNRIQGSTVSNKEHDLYTFYRFHTYDPVYFHEDCKVTIQQIGNTNRENMVKLIENGADISAVWSYVHDDGYEAAKRYLDMDNPPKATDADFPGNMSNNFYRSDDVSATAYFYLDKPESGLPALPTLEVRTKHITDKVYRKLEELK